MQITICKGRWAAKRLVAAAQISLLMARDSPVLVVFCEINYHQCRLSGFLNGLTTRASMAWATCYRTMLQVSSLMTVPRLWSRTRTSSFIIMRGGRFPRLRSKTCRPSTVSLTTRESYKKKWRCLSILSLTLAKTRSNQVRNPKISSKSKWHPAASTSRSGWEQVTQPCFAFPTRLCRLILRTGQRFSSTQRADSWLTSTRRVSVQSCLWVWRSTVTMQRWPSDSSTPRTYSQAC